MFAQMTAKALFRTFLSVLEEIYPSSEASRICTILFEKKAGISSKDLITDPERPLQENTVDLLEKCLYELKEHKPIQYITGEAWFYNMKLKVSPAVLVPRPETEELTEYIIRSLKEKPVKQLLDIGTGSGCISIAVKKNVPGITVTAIDFSEDALAVAQENAVTQNTPVNFIKTDFLDESSWEKLPVFDLVVSNPPYIPLNEKDLLDKNVTRYEPHLALFVENERPLVFYEKIALFGLKHVAPGGKIFLETHEHFAGAVANIFNNEHYHSEIMEDMHGKQRMVIVTCHHR